MGSISLDSHYDGFKDSSDLVHHDAVEEEEVEVSEKDLLLPPRKGGMSRHDDDKTLRKVQWNDRNGHSLVQVLEFDPSEESESDEEDLDSCICTIM